MECKAYIKRLEIVDSTNRYVRDEAGDLWGKQESGGYVVVTAEHQTAGRGQRGNTWSSNAGENLLFSVLVRPGEALAVSNQFLLSQAVALALHSALEHYGIDTRLKWPNDIYVGNRKLGGLLLEVDYCGAFVEQAIIGVGVNVNQEIFPKMDRVPVSMKILLGCDFSVEEVLATILNSFEYYYGLLSSGDCESIATEYSKLLLGLNELRTFVDSGGRFNAVLEGVEPSGHLLVRRSDGRLARYAFKEIEQLL